MEKTKQSVSEVNWGMVCATCRHLNVMTVRIAVEQAHCMRYPRTVVGGVVPTPNGPQVMSASVDNIVDEPAKRWCGEWNGRGGRAWGKDGVHPEPIARGQE